MGLGGLAGAGAAGAGGAGAAGAAGGAGMMGSLGAFFTNPWTIGIGAALAGGILLWKKFSKSVSEKFATEFGRDFGGVKIATDAVQTFLGYLGITEKQLEHIRKDVSSSPVFLQYAHDVAKSQGRTDAFLRSLESIKTAWGSFNFRSAFESGLATGDWKALNDAFMDAFGNSHSLVNIFGKDLAPLLLEVNDNAEEVADSFSDMGEEVWDFARAIRDDLLPAVWSLVDAIRDLGSELGLLPGGGLDDASLVPAGRGRDLTVRFDVHAIDSVDTERFLRDRAAPILDRLMRDRSI